jgi:hypothetical protein
LRRPRGIKFACVHPSVSERHGQNGEASGLVPEVLHTPTAPGAGPWFGLTPEQRTTLVSAVHGGYYDIPRGMSTQDLADEYDISDQAITERLRRGIASLVTHTLSATDAVEE